MADNPETRAEIRDFLASRRARIDPRQLGLPAGGRRRVPGLRREEVAVLAGVSTDWYTRLEKGHISGVSTRCSRRSPRPCSSTAPKRPTCSTSPAPPAAPPRRPPPRRKDSPIPPRAGPGSAAGAVDAGLHDVLGGVRPQRPNGHPGHQRAGTGALLADVLLPARRGATPANIARCQFLDPTAQEYFPNWDGAANVTVALPRAEAGRDPDNTELRQLIGELSTLSEEFRTRWAAHNVRIHRAGTKHFSHPEVGPLELVYHSLDLAPDDHATLDLTIYTAEPGTDSEDRLKLLASWAATRDSVNERSGEQRS